jgi:hypothetical protein
MEAGETADDASALEADAMTIMGAVTGTAEFDFESPSSRRLVQHVSRVRFALDRTREARAGASTGTPSDKARLEIAANILAYHVKQLRSVAGPPADEDSLPRAA